MKIVVVLCFLMFVLIYVGIVVIINVNNNFGIDIDIVKKIYLGKVKVFFDGSCVIFFIFE